MNAAHTTVTVSMAILGLALIIAAKNSPVTGAITWMRDRVGGR